jgi:hypothetical protein
MTDTAWIDALTLVRRLRPDFASADLLQRTGKTIVIGGAVAGQPVVAKVLLDRDPFWRDKFNREAAVYGAFTADAPPVRVPRLIDSDPAAGVLILERLTGRPLAGRPLAYKHDGGDTRRSAPRTLPVDHGRPGPEELDQRL